MNLYRAQYPLASECHLHRSWTTREEEKKLKFWIQSYRAMFIQAFFPRSPLSYTSLSTRTPSQFLYPSICVQAGEQSRIGISHEGCLDTRVSWKWHPQPAGDKSDTNMWTYFRTNMYPMFSTWPRDLCGLWRAVYSWVNTGAPALSLPEKVVSVTTGIYELRDFLFFSRLNSKTLQILQQFTWGVLLSLWKPGLKELEYNNKIEMSTRTYKLT